MVFHWCLSDRKFPSFSSTLLNILTDFCFIFTLWEFVKVLISFFGFFQFYPGVSWIGFRVVHIPFACMVKFQFLVYLQVDHLPHPVVLCLILFFRFLLSLLFVSFLRQLSLEICLTAHLLCSPGLFCVFKPISTMLWSVCSRFFNWFPIPPVFFSNSLGTVLSILFWCQPRQQSPQFCKFSFFFWPRLGDPFVCQSPIGVYVCHFLG